MFFSSIGNTESGRQYVCRFIDTANTLFLFDIAHLFSAGRLKNPSSYQNIFQMFLLGLVF